MVPMKRIMTFVLSFLLILCNFAYSETTNVPLVYKKGDLIQDFSFTTYDGQSITISELLKEKDAILINIFATWCGPCRSEFPFMEEAYRLYKEQVEVIALSCEPTDTADKLSAFAESLGLTFKMGQDPVDFLSALRLSSVPTTLLIDRFGTICFVESGAMPSADHFVRLFEAVIGDSYTESVLFDEIPPRKPTINASSVADVSAALEADAENPSDPYTWPMIVDKKDGHDVVISTNQSFDSTSAKVTVNLDAKANDAIVITFKTATEEIFDLFQIDINGEKVKSFGGVSDWMTYAIPVQKSGSYKVTLSYTKDATGANDQDCVWIDSVQVLSATEADASIASNPRHPVSDINSLTAISTDAQEILFVDPTGLLNYNFGDAAYWISNSDIIEFAATLDSSVDPEEAFIYSNFDGHMSSAASIINGDVYTFESGVDSYDTTGYPFSIISLYPDLTSGNHQIAVCFRDSANVERFVTQYLTMPNGTSATWQLVDNASSDGLVADHLPDEVSYTLKCVDQNGNPIPGVMLQVCDESTCQLFITDENGICEFLGAPYAWEVHILRAPNEYSHESETLLTPVEGGETLFTLTHI